MTVSTPMSLVELVDPVIGLIAKPELKDTLYRSFKQEQESVQIIEDCFQLVPTRQWSHDLLSTFVNSWKATHLKMLAIYGLSCRIQRQAAKADPSTAMVLYQAAAKNAETSYEDLGLDYDGHTHAELYEQFAQALVGDDSWQLGKYRLSEAQQFSRWVYRSMVVDEPVVGLFTNMFSEIYNHGEYSLALNAFDGYCQKHTQLNADQRKKAITYINVHVEDETEADHFLVVVDALERYCSVTGAGLNSTQTEQVFSTYLRNLSPVMQSLTNMMRKEASKK